MTRDRWLRVGQVAEMLGLSDESVYRRARAGQLAFIRDEITGTWRFSLASTEAYIRERLTPARPVLPTIPAARRTTTTPQAAPSDAPWVGSIFGRSRPTRDAAATARTTREAGPREENAAWTASAAVPRPTQTTRPDRPHAQPTSARTTSAVSGRPAPDTEKAPVSSR